MRLLVIASSTPALADPPWMKPALTVMAGLVPRLSGGILPIFRLAPIRLDDGIAWRPRTRKGSRDEASEFCPARDAELPSVEGVRRPGRSARGGQVGADAEHEVSVRGAVDRAAVGFLRFARDGGRGEQPGGATVSPGRARDCPLDVRRRQRAPPERGVRGAVCRIGGAGRSRSAPHARRRDVLD